MTLRHWLGGVLVWGVVTGTAASAAELTELNCGITSAMSTAGIFIAEEKGYFREAGIKCKMENVKGAGAKMVPFLATGQLHVAGGNVAAGLYNAIAAGIPIKIVADKGTVTPRHGYLALLVRKEHVDSGRYKTFKDLKGFTVALTADGVSQHVVLEKYLQSASLSLADIKIAHLAFPDMNVALANGAIDATIQVEPSVAAAVEAGIAVRVAGDDEIYPNQQSAVIMYSPVLVEKHPEAAKAWMVAYVRGLRDYNDAFEKGKNKEEIIQILMKWTPSKERSVYDKVKPVGLHPDGRLDETSLRSDAQWFVDKGFVKTLPNLDDVIDQSYNEHAVKVLGPYQ